MLSPLRNRFGIPGVISVIALVFAMLGGAYAASDNSGGGKATATAKGKQGPRGPRGKTGPQGPAGANGAKGDTGAAGSNGKDGADGAAGTSAKTKTFAGAKGSCTEGGIEVESATPVVLVCNGKKGEQGEPGPLLETLPKGKTMRGHWGLAVNSAGTAATAISLPTPVSGLTAAWYIKKEKEGEEHAAECPGSALEPEAAEGYLCVYTAEVEGSLGSVFVNSYAGEWGSPLFSFGGVSGSFGFGTWAATAK